MKGYKGIEISRARPPTIAAVLLATLWLGFPSLHAATTSQWIQDSYSINGAQRRDGTFNLTLSGNRKIISGGYRLRLAFTPINDTTQLYPGVAVFNTSCLSYNATASHIHEQVALVLVRYHRSQSVNYYSPDSLTVWRKGNATSYSNHGYTFHISGYQGHGLYAKNVSMGVAGYGSAVGCEDVITYGEWSDATQWSTGQVPGSSSQVLIKQHTGLVQLTGSVSVSTITVEGGTLVLGRTDCPSGWTPSPDAARNKCFRVFSSPLSQQHAQASCQSLGPQIRGHLARIESGAENNLVRGLCRGATMYEERGCWLGLKSDNQSADWKWENEDQGTMLDVTFRSWDWRQPNYYKHADRYRSCAFMRTDAMDPFTQLRGAWGDDDCEARRQYACEQRAETSWYTLSVTQSLQWRGGVIQGPGNVSLSGSGPHVISGHLSTPMLSGSATLAVKSALNITSTVFNGSSATIVNYGLITSGNATHTQSQRLVWPLTNTTVTTRNYTTHTSTCDLTISGFTCSAGGAQSCVCVGGGVDGYPPVLTNAATGVVVVHTATASTPLTLDWILQNYGDVRVLRGHLLITGGGYATRGTLDVPQPSSITLSGKAFEMMTPALQVLHLRSAYPVVDVSHPYGTNQGTGTYRLSFQGNKTSCIPYHATAQQLQDALNVLHSVQRMGNVTVWRSGRGSMSRAWGYGYDYTIAFDSITGHNRTAAAVKLDCQGSKNKCPCLDAVASFIERGSTRYSCASRYDIQTLNTSATVPSQCMVTPTVTVTTLTKHTQPALTGSGTLYVDGGGHLLPSAIGVSQVTIRGGYAGTRGSPFTAHSVSVEGGSLLLAGPGLRGMDAYRTFFAPSDAHMRSDSALYTAPATITGSVIGSLRVTGGVLLVASLYTQVKAGVMYWEGGSVGGRADLRVASYAIINGTTTTKRLRDGMRLINTNKLMILGGTLLMSEGASILNEGNISIRQHGSPNAHRIRITHSDGDAHSGRSWDEGWYVNPICGERCVWPSVITNLRHNSHITVRGNTSVRVTAYVDQRGVISVHDNSTLELSGGGQQNGTAYVASRNASMTLSGATYNFTPAAIISGSGTFAVNSGSHALPYVVGADVRVRGGEVVLVGRSVGLKGDVHVEGTGQVRMVMRAQNATAYADVTLRDRGVIRFEDHFNPYRDPRVTRDRSVLTVLGKFRWRGGTMAGHAVVKCRGPLDMDQDTKYLAGGVWVAYHNVAYWGTGDVVAKEGSKLLRKGIIHMKNASTFEARVLYEPSFDGRPDAFRASAENTLLQWQT